jgi:hypothetical protein
LSFARKSEILTPGKALIWARRLRVGRPHCVGSLSPLGNRDFVRQLVVSRRDQLELMIVMRSVVAVSVDLLGGAIAVVCR